MTPAVCTGATTGCAVALVLSLAGAGTVAVEIWQAPILVVFGLSLGLGLALFTQGARLIPSAFAALLGTAETLFGPLDRKSVVSGKSVSVRVDLGGRRISKNKTHQRTTNIT